MQSMVASPSRQVQPSPETAADRARELRALATAVNHQLRAPVVRVGPGTRAGPAVTSSGFPVLDAVTGLGGFPQGRLTELIGQPTTGRETVAARTVAGVPGLNAWVDVASQVDADRLARAGVDLTHLFILRPNTPSEALAITAHLLSSGNFGAVVLDALADLPPGGETATAIGQFVRVTVPGLARTTTVALILSAPEQHYRPLAHAAALRISLTQVGLIRQGGVFRGWRTQARILKSPGLLGGESGIEVWL